MFAQAAREVFQVDASALRGCKVGVRGWSVERDGADCNCNCKNARSDDLRVLKIGGQSKVFL